MTRTTRAALAALLLGAALPAPVAVAAAAPSAAKLKAQGAALFGKGRYDAAAEAFSAAQALDPSPDYDVAEQLDSTGATFGDYDGAGTSTSTS